MEITKQQYLDAVKLTEDYVDQLFEFHEKVIDDIRAELKLIKHESETYDREALFFMSVEFDDELGELSFKVYPTQDYYTGAIDEHIQSLFSKHGLTAIIHHYAGQ